jgi:hypothetical protein
MLSDESAGVKEGAIIFDEDGDRKLLRNSWNTTLQLKYPALSVL